MKTSDKILCTAKDLFNQFGATNVSTNHIAAELGISPGNLYYYYRNKEEIIRYIWYDLTSRLDPIWETPGFGTSEAVIAKVIVDVFNLSYQYRFFYREMPILLNRDPILKKEYSVRTQRILTVGGAIVDSWVSTGIMKKFCSEQDREFLILNTWIVGELWTTYIHMLYDQVTEDSLKKGVYQQYYSTLKPYFTSKSRKKIAQQLNRLASQ